MHFKMCVCVCCEQKKPYWAILTPEEWTAPFAENETRWWFFFWDNMVMGVGGLSEACFYAALIVFLYNFVEEIVFKFKTFTVLMSVLFQNVVWSSTFSVSGQPLHYDHWLGLCCEQVVIRKTAPDEYLPLWNYRPTILIFDPHTHFKAQWRHRAFNPNITKFNYQKHWHKLE